MSSQATSEVRQALAWAEEAHGLVRARPRQARALAEQALAAASAAGDVGAQVSAANALGWAQTVLGDGAAAEKTWRAGIRVATAHNDPRGIGILRRQLAVSLALAGKTRQAKREIDAALALLKGRDRAHAQIHRLAVHGRARAADPETHRQVLLDAGRALRMFRRDGEEIWEARLLYNLGLLHTERGELARAATELRRAHTLYVRAGVTDAAADALAQLAEVELLGGDVLSCLKS